MQLIPNAKIDIVADKDYEASPPREESRTTKFFRLFGAVRGNRQDVFCTAQWNKSISFTYVSDFRSNHATIKMVGNK